MRKETTMTDATTRGFSPWPRWAPPVRVTGTEWTRHVGGRLYAPHAPKPAA
jgi:hypothetical protein